MRRLGNINDVPRGLPRGTSFICGSFFSIGIVLVFIARLFVSIPGPMTLSELWYVPLGILACWMGFKWDDVIIEHYPTSIERKKIAEDRKELSRKP